MDQTLHFALQTCPVVIAKSPLWQILDSVGQQAPVELLDAGEQKVFQYVILFSIFQRSLNAGVLLLFYSPFLWLKRR